MNGNWITAWSMAHCEIALMTPKTAKKTIRTTIIGNVSGSKIRICLSNKMGSKVISVGSVYVRVGEQKNFQILFGGKPEINLVPGQDMLSDGVTTEVKAGDEIIVSLYYPWSNNPTSGSFTAKAVHSGKGDFSQNESFPIETFEPFMARIMHIPVTEPTTILAGVDIYTESKVNVVAAFGDSITHMGFWVNPLTSRLYKEYPERLALLNMGISGNRLLRDTGVKMFKQFFGLAGTRRMEWDLFKISGLTTVILALGINDIPQEPSSGMLAPKARDVCTYEELIEGYRNVITACHSRGIEVFGCTITPLGGYKTFNQKTEELRRKTNEWILNSGEFDRTFDFAAWISEVENPAYLPGEYDIGDHLHINERAGENIASKINLTI